MALNKRHLQKLSSLAKLEFNEEQETLLLKDINAIMNFVETLVNCDTSNVAPLFHPFDLHQRLRDDQVTEDNLIEELESIAPLFENGQYLVPKVLDSTNE